VASRERLRRGLTEFVAVVLGVVVGLAADEWRQGLQDRGRERVYLEQLAEDLTSGRARVANYQDRFMRVATAVDSLIRRIESGEPVADTAGFVRLASTAGQVGINRNDITYSATYEELISSGDLGLIRDAELRRTIVDHFRIASFVIEEVEELPLGYNTWFKIQTGYAPAQFASGEETPPHDVSRRLVRGLFSDPQAMGALREFRAELRDGAFLAAGLASASALLELVEEAR